MSAAIARIAVIVLLAASSPVELLSARTDDGLLIDPRLIAEAAEVWLLIASDENPIWPDWDASATPILFYLPGQQDVLINHPAPPEGFVPYSGPVRFAGGEIFLRNGPTIIEWDGQNTSRTIGRIKTLVVADTLSNLRMRLMALADDPLPASQKFPAGDYASLSENPYDQMAMIAHEAFHVHQDLEAPTKGGNELALKNYPVLAVANTVGFALEGFALAEAIRADDLDACRDAAARWLAVRADRRSKLSAEAIAYEDGTEFNEGLAKYVEYALFVALEGRTPGAAMNWVQGFRGYGDLSEFRESLIDTMTKHMNGEINVNNDPYGTAPLRMRLYFSGMAIGVILDRLSPRWKGEIFEPKTTLTGLARAAIDATDEELEAKLAETLEDPAYEALVEIKKRLAAAGSDAAASQLRAIEEGANTLLTIDYSALETDLVNLSFTPFGITGVDEFRTIYRMAPIAGAVKQDCVFSQTEPIPLLHDTKERHVRFRLTERLSRRALAEALGLEKIPREALTDCTFELPGVRLQAKRFQIAWSDEAVTITLRPVKK